jgi:nucleoside phosphorylase
VRYGPIYCCFLDREYSTNVGFEQSYEHVRRILYASLLSSDSYVYCSLSAIGECRGLAEFPRPFLNILLDEGLIVTVSDYYDPDQFLVSRRRLYRDDASRYPLYFESPSRESLALWEPRYIKTSSSTGYLTRTLPRQFGTLDQSTAGYVSRLEEIVRRVLAQRDDRAVTIALFDPFLRSSELYVELDYRLRSTISFLYTRQFLALFSGVLMTDLPFFQVHDRRFPDFLGPNYRIWRNLIPPAWIGYPPERDMRSLSELLDARSGSDLDRVRTHIRHIEDSAVAGPGGVARRRASELSIRSMVERANPGGDVGAFFRSVRIQLDAKHGERPEPRAPRLIVTCANSTEEQILRGVLAGNRGFTPRLVLAGDTTYWDLGRIGDVESFLVRTDIGSLGGAAALATLHDAIRLLSPTTVISCGVCFGLRPQVQRTGVAIVATRLRSYETVRVSTATDGSIQIRERGQAADVDPILSLRIRGLLATLPNVAFGEVISGEKLVDHINFRDQLLRRFPDALAGEMEGGGLVSACSRRRVPWLLIKGISDFGDGAKKVNEKTIQRRAARSAANVLMRLIDGGCFAEY